MVLEFGCNIPLISISEQSTSNILLILELQLFFSVLYFYVIILDTFITATSTYITCVFPRQLQVFGRTVSLLQIVIADLNRTGQLRGSTVRQKTKLCVGKTASLEQDAPKLVLKLNIGYLSNFEGSQGIVPVSGFPFSKKPIRNIRQHPSVNFVQLPS